MKRWHPTAGHGTDVRWDEDRHGEWVRREDVVTLLRHFVVTAKHSNMSCTPQTCGKCAAEVQLELLAEVGA